MRVTRKIFIFYAFIWVWLIPVCALAEGQVYQDLSHPITVTPADPMVSVRLQTNPSTGYQWVLMKYDSKLMEKPASVYEPSNTNLAGAPGYSVWSFKFKPTAFAAAQKTTVLLVYKRPWEKAPGKSLNIQILIKKE